MWRSRSSGGGLDSIPRGGKVNGRNGEEKNSPRGDYTGRGQSRAMSDAVIEVRNVFYALDSRRVLVRDLTLDVRRGETLVLLGRSGSGKTTTLKLVNRLLEPTAGEVRVEGRAARDWGPIRLRRHIGYVIQEVGLFPYFTVERNIGLVPAVEGWTPARIDARVRELLELVGLDLAWGSRHAPPRRPPARVPPPPAAARKDHRLRHPRPARGAPARHAHRPARSRAARRCVHAGGGFERPPGPRPPGRRGALLPGPRIALLEAGRLEGVYTPAEFLNARQGLAADYVALAGEK